MTSGRSQTHVTRHFDEQESWWDHIYEDDSLQARILRRRQQVALAWIDSLQQPRGSRALEIGCGAGAMAVELARRGYVVCAVDSSKAMALRTHRRAMASGVGDAVTTIVGDAHRLMFPKGSFDLVISLGVLSWLQSPPVAVNEMARVTRAGGSVIVTWLNAADLPYLLDPRRSPMLSLARGAKKSVDYRLGRRARSHKIAPTRYQSRYVRRLLHSGRLDPILHATVGFGPFRFWNKALLSEEHAIRLDEALQRCADNGTMLLRSTGRLALILACKPGIT